MDGEVGKVARGKKGEEGKKGVEQESIFMNFRLVIHREQSAKDIQVFAPDMESLKKAAEAELSNLPRGTTASLYQTKEERVGVVRVERADGRWRLVEVQAEEAGGGGGGGEGGASEGAGEGGEKK